MLYRVVVSPFIIQGGLEGIFALRELCPNLYRFDAGTSGGSCFFYFREEADANETATLAVQFSRPESEITPDLTKHAEVHGLINRAAG